MSEQTPARTYCKRSSPCPTIIQISRMPRHWKLTKHHRTTRPPFPPMKRASTLPKIARFLLLIISVNGDLQKWCFVHLYYQNNRISDMSMLLQLFERKLQDMSSSFKRIQQYNNSFDIMQMNVIVLLCKTLQVTPPIMHSQRCYPKKNVLKSNVYKNDFLFPNKVNENQRCQ